MKNEKFENNKTTPAKRTNFKDDINLDNNLDKSLDNNLDNNLDSNLDKDSNTSNTQGSNADMPEISNPKPSDATHAIPYEMPVINPGQ